MSDPRLVRWAELTEAALARPEPERAAALEELASERAELQRSLETTPPAQLPDAELAGRLRRAETELGSELGRLRHALLDQLEGLRDARRAAQGYRPARGNRPAFVSRSA